MDSTQSKPMHTLYLLKFASGKNYIGQTVRALTIRMNQHRTASNRGSMLPVHCAWRAHGAPVVEVLGEFDSHECLHRAEIEAIARLGTQSPGGYNVSIGGDTAPSKNPEVAKKIAARAKGRKHADTGVWSEAVRKRWQDPEARARMIAGSKAAYTDEMRAAASQRSREFWERRRAEGWTMPEATKEKMRGKTFSDETRARMSASAKGKVISDATKAKMSAASSARKYGTYPDERCRNISEGIKAAWADPVKRAELMAKKQAAAARRKEKAMEPTS